MCRNHSHVAALPLGPHVLTPYGLMQGYALVNDFTIETPTGENVIYPRFTIFYVPCQICGDCAALGTPQTGGPTDAPSSWTEEEPTSIVTTPKSTTKR